LDGTVVNAAVVDAVVPAGTVVDGTVVDGTVVDAEDPVGGGGAKVATNGVCSGAGSTTGIPLTDSVTGGAPSSRAVAPVAGMFWTPPAVSSPDHSVAWVATVEACAQQTPEALMVIVKEAKGTV